MTSFRMALAIGLFIAADLALPLSDARAELVLSELVVDLQPGQNSRADVEIWNNGPDRSFVAVDPREILDAGSPKESIRKDPDPEKLGLLVSPERLILEPGQRRLLRIASIEPADRERIYRVTVKPVVGPLASAESGLKVLVGYDVLVLVRPPELRPHVSGSRSGDQLTLRNDGNVSVELVDGKTCNGSTKTCADLPGGRLYAGSEKTVKVASGWKADYKLKVGAKLVPVTY
jgi:P pilus assembly chaperone PapD